MANPFLGVGFGIGAAAAYTEIVVIPIVTVAAVRVAPVLQRAAVGTQMVRDKVVLSGGASQAGIPLVAKAAAPVAKAAASKTTRVVGTVKKSGMAKRKVNLKKKNEPCSAHLERKKVEAAQRAADLAAQNAATVAARLERVRKLGNINEQLRAARGLLQNAQSPVVRNIALSRIEAAEAAKAAL